MYSEYDMLLENYSELKHLVLDVQEEVLKVVSYLECADSTDVDIVRNAYEDLSDILKQIKKEL